MEDDVEEILRMQAENKKSLDLLHWKIEMLAGRLALEIGMKPKEKSNEENTSGA